MKTYFFLIYLFVVQSFIAQENELPNYHPPMKIPMVLSANFGELRPNHFHMGVDFKTNGRTGYNLYAIEDGYVARIKVSPYGYGRVIYINHPNGITSVYAHCLEFKGEIDSITKATQYATENYEVEIFPGKDEIKVSKGEVIALSGNSGSSTAPHLHFEIRDTQSEHCLNPLVFGFDVADHKSPEIRRVKAYGVTKDGYLIPGKEKELAAFKSGNGYAISGNTLTVPASYVSETGGIGLAFDIIDRLDAASNQCGLYGTFLIVEGDTLFGQKTDRISFDYTRYINSHKDYDAYKSLKRKYHKSFRNVTNPLQIYIDDQLGVIPILPGESKKVKLVAYDPKGNTSSIEFNLVVTNGEKNDFEFMDDYLFPQNDFSDSSSTFIVKAESGTLYEPALNPKNNIDHFCAGNVPIQQAIEVRKKMDSTTNIQQYYISVFDGRSNRALETNYENGWLIASSKYAGTFSIKKDATPPAVRGISYNSAYTVSGNTIKLSVREEESGLADYDLYIDGKWHLMEFENKGDYFEFTRPEGLIGEHEIKIIVKDICGNTTTYIRTLKFL